MDDDRFSKFDKPKTRAGKKEENKKTKKILLSMTEKKYAQLQRFQELLGKKTLTSTIEHFIDQGIQRGSEEYENARER